MSNFQPLEVVGRGSETQLQAAEHLNKITLRDKGQCMYSHNVLSLHRLFRFICRG